MTTFETIAQTVAFSGYDADSLRDHFDGDLAAAAAWAERAAALEAEWSDLTARGGRFSIEVEPVDFDLDGENEELVTDALAAARRRVAVAEWREATEEEVERLAEQHGWRVDLSSVASTGTRYYRLRCVCDAECEHDDLTLRISDHASAHCSEDISLAFDGGGDDHTIDALARRLSRGS